jgi:CheY-like chemotaxis protein
VEAAGDGEGVTGSALDSIRTSAKGSAGKLRQFEFPIIFMTGSADDTVRMQSMEPSCVAFLHKPFPEGQLMDAVTSTIGLKLQPA